MTDTLETKPDKTTGGAIRRWITLGVVLVLIAGGFAALSGRFGDTGFDVKFRHGYPGAEGLDRDLPILSIQSRKEGKITLNKVIVNDDDACVPFGNPHGTMSLGATATAVLACDPVKVIVATDRGNFTYWMHVTKD